MNQFNLNKYYINNIFKIINLNYINYANNIYNNLLFILFYNINL